MSGPLNDEPGLIIRQMLEDNSLVTDPEDELDWPCFHTNSPDDPSSQVCITDTAPIISGRTIVDGQTIEQYGFQVKVQARRKPVAWHKINRIKQRFDAVIRDAVFYNGSTYVIQAVNLTSGILNLGVETANRVERKVYALNATADIYMISAEDTGTGS